MAQTMRKRLIVTAAVAAFGLVGVACGSDNNTTSSSGSSSSAAAQSGSSSPQATIASLSGVGTTVDIDAGTAGVLQQNGVSVAPVAPATASTAGGGLHVTFPITGGNVSLYDTSQLPFIRGSVMHSGGLTFSAGGKSLTVTNFIVDPGASTLTATAGGAQVKIFDLNGSGVKVTKDAAGHVHLDGTIVVLSSDAATALNSTFGVTLFKQGIVIGVAHIEAAG